MKPWGCSNKERKSGYWAMNGRSVDELGNFVFRAVWVEDRMTQECGYDNKSTDDRCKGCKDNAKVEADGKTSAGLPGYASADDKGE